MRRKLLATMLCVALMSTAAACGEAADVRLGAILSLEGEAASYGRSIANGVELAVEQVNDAGGIVLAGRDQAVPLVLELRDAKSNPEVGNEAAHELIEMGVPAVVGSDSSDVTLAIAPHFEDARVVLLSPSSSSPKLTRAGEYIYRNFPSDELEALNVGSYVYNKRSIRTVGILANQNEYGIGIKNAFIERFRSLGGRIVAQETYPPDIAEAEALTQQAGTVAGAEPDAVYLAGYAHDIGHAARALRDAGYDGPLIATGAVLPEELVAAGGDAVEGLIYPQPAYNPDAEDEDIQEFVRAYRDRFGSTPDAYAAHGYDAVKILAQAFEQVGADPPEVRFYLNTMNPYKGVAGLTNFDDNGDVRKFHRMFEIQDGSPVELDVAAAGASTPS